MIRYRSALVLILFMLLGAAWHGDLSQFALQLSLAAIALISTYACATCVNDLADSKIDQINLKGHSDRPLITGEAGKNDLIVVSVAAALLALGLGFILSVQVVLLVGIILFMNVMYSLPPLRVSHRPLVTPFYLVAGYTVMPYLIGVAITGSSIGATDRLLLPSLYLLFLARISLKDFRDREGDAKNHKPTIILKYGKMVTCWLSLVSLAAGGALLLISLRHTLWLVAGLSLYLLACLVL